MEPCGVLEPLRRVEDTSSPIRLGAVVPIVYPSDSSVSDRRRRDRIGVSEPPASLLTQGIPRVSETSGGDRNRADSSKGSQVQILSARPTNRPIRGRFRETRE